MATKIKLSISERIDRAMEGRKQGWVVGKMKEAGIKIDETRFSRKKKGHEDFSDEELTVLSEILGTDLK